MRKWATVMAAAQIMYPGRVRAGGHGAERDRDTRAGKAAGRPGLRSYCVHGASQSADGPGGAGGQQPGYRDRIAESLTGTGNDAVAVNAQATATVQQQYDIAYSACMYAKGDNVPPNYMQPTQYAEPTGAHRGKRRTAHKPSSPTTASGSGQGAGSGFVVPAAAAPAGGGGGFVEPAATASASPAASSGGFAVPPPAAH